MRRFAVILAVLTLAVLYFTPNADAFGRRHRNGGCNECGNSCECNNCECNEGRRFGHRRHRGNECCESHECHHVNYAGCWGGYGGCGGGCVGIIYQPVVTYRPVAVYHNYGCLGSVSCGCCGNYGVGVVGGGHWEWKPGAKPMPPDKPERPDRPGRPNRPGRDGGDKDKDGGNES